MSTDDLRDQIDDMIRKNKHAFHDTNEIDDEPSDKSRHKGHKGHKGKKKDHNQVPLTKIKAGPNGSGLVMRNNKDVKKKN